MEQLLGASSRSAGEAADQLDQRLWMGEEAAMPAGQLRRIRIPVGLDIGGTTPEEIALSVLAEAVAVHHGRAGGPMRDRGSS